VTRYISWLHFKYLFLGGVVVLFTSFSLINQRLRCVLEIWQNLNCQLKNLFRCGIGLDRTHKQSLPRKVTGKEPATPMACLFSGNPAALASSVVHYHIMEIMEALRMGGLWLVAFLAGTAPAGPIPYSIRKQKNQWAFKGHFRRGSKV